jgi:hypothetical protein
MMKSLPYIVVFAASLAMAMIVAVAYSRVESQQSILLPHPIQVQSWFAVYYVGGVVLGGVLLIFEYFIAKGVSGRRAKLTLLVIIDLSFSFALGGICHLFNKPVLIFTYFGALPILSLQPLTLSVRRKRTE